MVNTQGGTAVTATDNVTAFRRTLLNALIASLSVGAMVAIALILGGGEFDETAWRVIGSAFSLALYSVLALGAFHLARRRDDLGWLVVVQLFLAGYGFVSALVAIWGGEDTEGLWQAAGVGLVLALGAAHSSLLLGAAKADETPASRFIRQATICLAALLSVLGAIGIGAGEGSAELVAVLGVLFLLGNALLPLVRRLEASSR
jgi:hypothetical protein